MFTIFGWFDFFPLRFPACEGTRTSWMKTWPRKIKFEGWCQMNYFGMMDSLQTKLPVLAREY